MESFLQAQKVSVRKTLQRSFRRYVTYGEENNQLIMHQLQNLIMEVEKYKMVCSCISMRLCDSNFACILLAFVHYFFIEIVMMRWCYLIGNSCASFCSLFLFCLYLFFHFKTVSLTVLNSCFILFCSVLLHFALPYLSLNAIVSLNFNFNFNFKLSSDPYTVYTS